VITGAASDIRRGFAPPAAYAGVAAILLLYCASVAIEESELFFLVLLGAVVLAVGLVRFEAAFLFVPIALTNPVALRATGTNLILSEYILLIIFFLFVVRMQPGDRSYTFPRPLVAPTAWILAASLVSLAAARFVVPATLQFVRFVEVMVLLLFVITSSLRSAKAILRVVLFLMLGGTVAAVTGLSQFLAGISVTGESQRVYGLLGGGFGAVAAMTLLLSAGALFFGKDRLTRVTALVAAPLAVAALVASQTRAWIGAFGIALVILFLTSGRSSRKVLVAVITGVAVMALIFFLTDGFGLLKKEIIDATIQNAFRFGPREGVRGVQDLSILMRFNLWLHAAREFAAHPVTGIGLGNLRFDDMLTAHIGPPSPKAGYVDNQYVQMFVETGVVGGLAWILYVVRGVRLGFRSLRAARGTPLAGAAWGLFGCALVMIVGSFFWVVTPSHELFAILILILGLLSTILRYAGDQTVIA
jgi:O-antigen ligase